MTSPAAAQSLSVFAVATAVTLTSVSSLSAGKLPPARVFIGGAVVAVVMTGAAEFIPGIIAPLAGVILITSVFVSGAPAYRALSKLTRK